MKKKSAAFSSPPVSPQMSNSLQSNNLTQTGAHDIGGFLANPREIIKTARQQALRAELVREQRFLAEKLIDADDDAEGGQP